VPVGTELAAAKRQARAGARVRRAAAAAAAGDWAARALAHLRGVLAGRAAPYVLAGYHPLAGEADVRPVLTALAGDGAIPALPVAVARGEPLQFRLWRPGDALAPGLFGVLEPPADAPPVRPDVLLVPLLAFDRQGRRLGYGAGFYDRTIAGLRGAGPAPLCVGVGFAGQEMERVPADGFDAVLDWIVTEAAALRIG
jgi:5-formyltetrahydrofolate cyclo-ligase